MTKILTGIFLGTLITIGSAAIAAGTGADPVVGTWKLNAAKSTFSAGPALKSQTRIYSQSAQGITLNMKTVGADGKEINSQTTYQLDGKDYLVTGVAAYDSLSGKQVDGNTAEFILKMAGKAVGKTRRTVSKDGKTLTSTLKMTNEKGEKTENVTVFDKQ
jgi:2',3'-cyclic-nucleotide 2'-phosphodiesterase (5'-nucleotidase family)